MKKTMLALLVLLLLFGSAHASSTSISCNPSQFTNTTDCTVTVTVDSGYPMGIVSFQASPSLGTFNGCSLVSSATNPLSASCDTTYTDRTPAAVTITATYTPPGIAVGISGTTSVTESSGLSSAKSNSAGCGLLPYGFAQQVSANESWYCPINQQVYQQWGSSLPIALVAVLLAFSIASMIVMVGIAFKNERMRNFGIAEIYEALASAIMVGVFLYVCAVMFGLAPGVFVGNINPYATSLSLISGTINQAQSLYTSLFDGYMTARWFATQSITMAIPGFPLSVQDILSFIILPLNLIYIDP